MAAWRRAIELSLGDEDTVTLRSIAQSRTEPASRVERARILLAYREDPSTRAWVAEQPAHRFEFTFTPTHGSWLNLVEGFFSKLARSVLRHIRVASKQELKDRIMAAMDYFNQQPVVHTWSFILDKAA